MAGSQPAPETASTAARVTDGATLALAFATIGRPQVAQRLVLSARRRFPDLPIYVADQSLDAGPMSAFYRHMNVTAVRMPYDAGVCASRNRLVECMSEEFFVLCDDDFVIGEATDFSEALRILRHCPELGVVGGKLYDYDGAEERPRHWEHYLLLDQANRTLTVSPIYHYAPRARVMGATRFYLCDAVMNFAVMRRDMFAHPSVQWDEQFKSNGEHEDFYLNLKLNSPFWVAYLPTMVAYHHHPGEFAAYRAKLRDRVDGWKRFLAKWDIDQHLEIGLGVRSISRVGDLVPEADARSRFFLNDDLCLWRQRDAAGLLIDQADRLGPFGGLDADREPAVTAQRAWARLLIHSGGDQVIGAPGPAAPGPETRRPQAAADALRARYSFEPPAAAPESAADRRPDVRFCYNPVARLDEDFLLWYRMAPARDLGRADRAVAPGAFGVSVRWFADDGRALTWAGEPKLLDPRRTDYWTPVAIELPLWPRACHYMRFEVITSGAGAPRPVASGFVFAPGPSVPGAGKAIAPVEPVLALCAWCSDLGKALGPAVNLDLIGSSEADFDPKPEWPALVPAMMLLRLDGPTAVDALILHGWQGLGSSLVSVPVPGEGASDAHGDGFPHRIALPRQAGQLVQILAFRHGKGFQRLRANLADEALGATHGA